jgi:class 3 adenylate cyclase/tetratricopeptide (TPR) repeat protein
LRPNLADNPLSQYCAAYPRLSEVHEHRLAWEARPLDYKPVPFDASRITLSREIFELRELLARNAHENWARLRMADGWRYGPERNDVRKEHPGLIPFERLLESEKEYDRQTALETIKTLLALGYTIQSPAAGSPIFSERSSIAFDKEPGDVVHLPTDPAQQDHASLRKFWRGHDPETWGGNAEAYKLIAERILKLGEPLFAYDVVAEAIRYSPHDVRLRQLLALALARSGAAESANSVLSGLYKDGHRDEETLGLLARTHKDLARETIDPCEATEHFRQAYKFYAQAYRATGGYWSGINAATLALFLSEREQAVALAREVSAQCRVKLARVEEPTGDRYWLLSTLGEAALLLGRWSEAEEWYGQAVELGRGNWGNLQSTRHNALFLLKHLHGDGDLVDRVFRFPSVVVFTGHMVDRPDREIPRFPPQVEYAVKGAIRQRLEKLNAGFGYASAACGSDILFHEAILERKGESHVVLPYEKQFFVEASVDIVSNPEWVTRCNAILARAMEVQEASKRSQICGRVSYVFADLMLHGLASVHAEQLETKLVPMAVWDGKPGDGPDGTAGTVERWQNSGLAVEIIDLREILSEQCIDVAPYPSASTATFSRPTSPTAPEFASEIRALLFADAHGFSELADEQVPRFVQHFLGLAGRLASGSSHKPLMKNTWGDGLYFVFSNVRDAGQFALDLRDGVRFTDWPTKGLPNLNLRIGLHAGPVYCCTDPVTQRANYIGAHVSRAARIEPITPTGQVYASQVFAALAAAEGVKEFRCDYVGQTSMAKKYGTFPTYVVRRSAAR